ncbi:hypothetical protein [Nocardia sp. NPDC052566]|uniref:hypothetical protein n=1 Tax=Nocardia sp. NPDC052566 TaxID=3364330 RepID=UPI0037C6250C
MIASSSDTRARLVAETDGRSTAALATALEVLTFLGKLDEAERMVRGIIIETLYDRHAEVAAAYNTWIDDLESDETDEAVIIKAARRISP